MKWQWSLCCTKSPGMGGYLWFLESQYFFVLICCILVFFHLEAFLDSGEIHWQLPTCWTLLLEEILGFSKQQDGTKKAHMSRRNLDLTPQKTFLKLLVKWSWILFTYERGKLSLLPSIKPQCTILFFALYSFYWASIVSWHNNVSWFFLKFELILPLILLLVK